MNKKQFAQLFASSTIFQQKSLQEPDAYLLVGAFFKLIKECAINEEDITISGVGTFRTVTKKSRNGVNPHTMEKMVIPAKKFFKFIESQYLRRIDGK